MRWCPPSHTSPLLTPSPRALQKRELSAEKKAAQEKVDAAVGKKLSETMKKYLKARFTLSKGQAPHKMKF